LLVDKLSYESPEVPPERAAHDAHVSPNARLGLVLFAVYCVLYFGFMAIATFKYDLFGSTTPVGGGVNLAILYGMGLIAAALVLAVVYMLLCKRER
jgi:uncharacterized membrane protein (DUF485 family)